jgi:hypothetical protein
MLSKAQPPAVILVTLGLVRPHESLSGRGLLRVFQKAAASEAGKQK